ncbi:RNA-directed RNA polymerase L [Rhizoctonia solani]|uniref:RNA-directed RNA polymerase L n=1 Tax=Rhizoctonia solani TaxID=456999 RepID=A0A0K6GCA8_9AGAM|nr:RNA-directed RNA polymerase L [Rhizoctonia solani]
MPPALPRRKICPRCLKPWTPRTVYRHLALGCTRRERKRNRIKALNNIVLPPVSPPRRSNLPLRLRNAPPSSPQPPPVSPQRHKRGGGSQRKRKRRGSHRSTQADSGGDCDLHGPTGGSYMDVRMRSPDFAFDTPGAGPSNAGNQYPGDSEDDEEIFRFYEDDWDGNVPIDSDSDDGRPEGPTLAENAPWLQGLTARDILGQELEAELARNGGRTLNDDDMKAVRGFNYKVDTDMSARAYDKLPRAFPDELGDLPKTYTLRTRMARLSGIKGVRIDCCVNSCMAFTDPFDTLDYCLFCLEGRYRPCSDPDARPTARKYFQYLPIIPRLINMYRHPQTAEQLAYRSMFEHIPQLIRDIFDGAHYRRLCRSRVVVGGETLPHDFFSLPTDIALGLSSDGFGPFKSRKQSCWPLLAFNYNLKPEIRFRLENLLCLGVIPGPKAPKDIGTFLGPFIDELEDLARGVPAFDSRYNRTFALRAHLIACFGDMPAVAKLMCMKGHNDPAPGDDNKTNYTPLSRPFVAGRHEPREFDPLALPRRTHAEFIAHAQQVDAALNDAEADRRSRHYGINSLSPLARLSSLDFPGSFPHDFMHAIFENVIALLIDLWTRSRKFATFGTGNEDYILDKDIFKGVAAAAVESGKTIPSVFGCRIPNLVKDRWQSTAESTLIFTTLLAPALLRDQFDSRQYYTHFLKLVQLIDMCMGLELPRSQVQVVREGFANWVVDFERLYYRHSASRLRVCTLPIHSLLHIADDIETMGPVWCYWAFPMERFCGALVRANLNPRFPYASLDRRVLEVAQLAQIKLMYSLFETLDLGDRKHAMATGTRYPEYPRCIFVRPHRSLTATNSLAKHIGKYLGALYGVNPTDIERRTRGLELDVWGKMQQTTDMEGLDTINGYSLMPDTETPRRDATYIKYTSKWDRSAGGRPKQVASGAVAFGRVEYFLILEGDFILELLGLEEGDIDADDQDQFPETIALAVISPIPSFKRLNDCNLITYNLVGGKLGTTELVDVQELDCLVGRVRDLGGRWFIVDRTTAVGKIDFRLLKTALATRPPRPHSTTITVVVPPLPQPVMNDDSHTVDRETLKTMTYGMYNPETYEDVLKTFGISRSRPIDLRSRVATGFAGNSRNPAPGRIDLPTTGYNANPHETLAVVIPATHTTTNAALSIFSLVNPLPTPPPDEFNGQPLAMGLIISQTAVMGISEPTAALGGHN